MSPTDELIVQIEHSGIAEPDEIFKCDTIKMLKFLFTALKQEVLSDSSRFGIVRELGLKRQWAKKDRGEDIAKTLVHIAKNDTDENVRSMASDTLSYFIDVDCSLACLESIASNGDEFEFVRASAIARIRGGYFTAKRMKKRRKMKACVKLLKKLKGIEDIAADVDIELDIIDSSDDEE